MSSSVPETGSGDDGKGWMPPTASRWGEGTETMRVTMRGFLGWTSALAAGGAAGCERLRLLADVPVTLRHQDHRGAPFLKFLLGPPFNFWMGVIGGTVMVMSSHGAEQLIVQRVLACKSVRDGRRALVLSAVLIFPLFLIFLLVGAMLWVFYPHPFQIPLPEPRPGSGIGFSAPEKPRRPVAKRIIAELPYIEWAYKQSLEAKPEE